MKSNTRSKILSVLLSAVMLVSIIPIPVLAQEDPANTSDTVEANAAGGKIDDNMDRNWNAGTYTLNKNVTINGRVTISGKVTLVLSSGTLTINGGIYVPDGSELTIKGSGTLIADARGNDGAAGIGGNEDKPAGTIKIKEQAHVTAWGGEDAAGIGGGYDSDSSWNYIYFYDNCTVKATGNEGGAGIGSGGGNKYIGLIQVVNAKEITATGGDDGAGISGKVIINGGTVNAEGSKGAGIGSNKREDFSTTVEITGGTVTATSTGAAGIGAGLFADFETGGEVIISGGKVTATAGMYSGTFYSSMGSAGIGSSVAELTPGHFSGTVKISGGTVIANGGSAGMNNGNGGAGIGSAFNSNARDGEITITGGRVDAYGGSGAAGIGGGAEDWNNDGGEGCDNVKILGGIVYAASGSIETGTKYTNTSAIGHGDNDGHMGSITFADNMMVQGGWNYSETRRNTPFEAGSREVGCQYRWCAFIQPCKHQDKTFEILDDNQHLQYCKYCNEKFESEDHVLDENGKCKICGLQKEMCTVTFNAGAGSGTMPSKKVSAGGEILLPSCVFTEPEKQSFYAWEIDGELYPDNVFYTVTKDTKVTARYAQSFPLWVNGIQVNTNNMKDVLGDGTVSFTGNENGGQLILDGALINKGYTFNHDSMEYVAGIYSDLPQLTIQTINPSSVSSKRDNDSQRAYGIFSNHALTLTGSARLNASAFNAGINNGGLLTIQNGDVVAEGSWYGIEMNAGMTVDNSTVTATGTYDEGISSNTSNEDRLIIKGTKTVVTVEGRENGSCLFVGVVHLQDSLSVVEPAGGYISGGYVYDAVGNQANRAVIRGATLYPVWVGNVQVTSANKDNLCNGAASYDPVTGTLTFTSNPNFANETNYHALIRSDRGLTVRAPESGLTLNSQQANFGIYTSGDLTIDGNIDIQVKKTAIHSNGQITAGGNVTVQAKEPSAGGTGTDELIYASEDIRIEGDLSGVNYNGSGVISTKGSVYVAGDSILVANYGTLLSAMKDITVCGAVATMKSKGGGAWDTNSTTTGFRAGGSIHMTTATEKWEIETKGTAMQAKAIYIPATHEITKPVSGSVANNPDDANWKTIVKGNNVIANNVTIQLKTQPTNVWTVTFRDGTRILFTQTVADGGKAIRPIDLTKEGYEFKGWKSSTSTTAWNFDTDTITTNTTLDALWEVIEAPVITVGMPEDKTWTQGAGDENRTLTVQVQQEEDNLTYQWYRIGNDGHTGEAIPEATGVNYTVPADTPAGEYQYYCVVTKTQGNGSRSTTSRYATVTVQPGEGDITPPKPINLTYNGTVQKLVRPGSVSSGTLQYKLNEGEWSDAIPTAANAGTYTVYYKTSDMTEAAGSISTAIGRKKVYVIADDKTKIYGEADPNLTWYQIGLLGNDQLESADCSREQGNDVGRYKISVTATAGYNYIVVSIPGYLTITKAPASVTQAPTANTLSYTSSAQALVNAGVSSAGGEMQYAIGEDRSTAPATGWSTAIPTATNAGTYYVWYKVVGDANHNDVAPEKVSVSIGKADATITAKDQTIKEGESVAGGTGNVEVSGLLTGHNLDAISLESGTGETAGKVIASNARIKDGNNQDVTSNYTVEYRPGTLTVRAALSRTVTFKVANGSWNDETTADKTVTLTGYEGDTLKLAANQIPAVGDKPGTNYKAGSWDVTPSADTEITADTTYTYTYAQKNAISQTVTFKVVNGSWNEGDGDAATADKTVTLTGYEGDTLKLAASQIPAVGDKPGTNYKAGSWDVTPSADTEITKDTTYTYTYAAKDSITQTVTFKVVNGSWNDETTADKTVTLTGKEGDTLKLTADQIPAVGSKPNDIYKAGSWDVTPSTDTEISADTTYTYTYGAKEAADVTKAPTAKTLTYNGQAQELVNAGEADGGNLYYAVTTENTAPTDDNLYTTTIPSKTEAGTYYVWYKVVGDDHHTDTQPAAIEVTISEVPVFSVQVTNDGNGTAEANPASGETGTEVTLTAEAKEGYRFREWQVISGGVTVTDNRFRIGSANAEIRAIFEEIPVEPVQPVTYATVSAVGAMHTIGSGENAVITVERSTGDKRELELFTGAAVDGILVPDGSYSAAKGSLILTLKSAYLDTLREGEHKVTISFQDGSAEAALTIRRTGEPAVTTLPKTGDGAKPVLWLGMIAAGLAMAIAARSVKKRRDR